VGRRSVKILPTWNISVPKQLGSATEIKQRLLQALPGVRHPVVGDDAGTAWVFVVACEVRTREDIQQVLQRAGIGAKALEVRGP